LELVQQLRERLIGVVMAEGEYSWDWKSEDRGIFSVKSCYLVLEMLWLVDEGVTLEEVVVFLYLWKSLEPSKVLAFSLTLVFEHIPTRLNLAERNLMDVLTQHDVVFVIARGNVIPFITTLQSYFKGVIKGNELVAIALHFSA
jgi:hypothetical protein